MSVKYKLIENTVKLYIWDGADVIIPLSRAKGEINAISVPLAPTSEPEIEFLKFGFIFKDIKLYKLLCE